MKEGPADTGIETAQNQAWLEKHVRPLCEWGDERQAMDREAKPPEGAAGA